MHDEPGGPELTDETSEMPIEGAANTTEELRKRRSTRIVQAVPLQVTGVDALGRPFAERTSTLIINCHGCRYQSKHYVLKNMWVNLEVPHPEQGHPPRRVRGKVAWIQRPRTVRQLFQVALELEAPGNAWGIAFPPDDWFAFPEENKFLSNPASAMDLPPSIGMPTLGDTPLPIVEAEPGVATPDNVRVFPAPASATDASLQLARQLARLLAEAKQQIQTAAKEAATHAVTSERQLSADEWERKYTAFREEVARETAHAIGTIQEETEARARTAQAAAAESLKNELPRWLAPQLEQLTHELMAHLAREGALQRDQHEKQLASAQETLQTMCTQAEEAAAKLRANAEQVESEVAARVEAVKQQAEEAAGAQKDSLGVVLNDIQEKVSAAFAEAQNAMREQLAQELGFAQQQTTVALQEQANRLHEELKQEGAAQSASVMGSLGEHARQLEEVLARANQATERLEQYAARIETVQQGAISGFQSQLEDVLSQRRNELHRQSDTLFEETYTRIRSSFEAANSEALEKFEQHVESMVQPHITRTEEAVHRLAGGRSLLDAALTMQQDRIRNSADEAFAESLARFRENLGTVEQVLNESAQGITARHLDELEGKAVDLKHHTMEEMFKSAEWYEKKAHTQLQGSTEKMVEQAGAQLREKAGEVSSVFASELNHASRSYVEQSHRQMEESVRESFERIRILSAEAADTTSAAFTDEIQRNGRQELEGFMELMQKTVEESRERLDAARAEMSHKLTVEQDEFLRRFQAGMGESLDQKLAESQEKVRAEFEALWESWKKMNAEQQAEVRSGLHKLGDEAVGEFRGRLENISNSWMVATVTTLNHQSREVIAQIAATAEERLREASAEVFATFGETLREKLQQIAAGFEKGRGAKAGGG
ncbi:MAG TPA: hypothetical protein VNY24_15615 [Candidatus Acidoferrales bacterium]|nr:hypothetical protein [Candidatus Acidoferrales bacterium]